MDTNLYPNIIIYDILKKYINEKKFNNNFNSDVLFLKEFSDVQNNLTVINDLVNKQDKNEHTVVFDNEKEYFEEKENYNEYSKAIIEYNNYFNSIYKNDNICAGKNNENEQNDVNEIINQNINLDEFKKYFEANFKFEPDYNEQEYSEQEYSEQEYSEQETNLDLGLKSEFEKDDVIKFKLLAETSLETKNELGSKSKDNDDPWESSINDDKFYISNKVARIFPVLKNFNNFSKIKIDDESFCYITIREIADIMSKIICFHLLEHNLNPQKSKIVDYTSGVGGNVLSFSKYFKYVYAIELSEKRAEYLQNNINVYGFKNIQVINGCAIEFSSSKLLEINPSVIFIDPPWGGVNYKNSDSLILNLGSVPIEELIFQIATKFSNYYIEVVNSNPKEKSNNFNNKFIILKLPKNYDIEYLYNFIKSKNNFPNYNISLFLYILNKMLIVVCELQYKFYL